MRLVFEIIQVVLSVILVLTIIFQSGSKEGLGVIGGASESFASKGKIKTIDAKLQKLTIVVAILFIVTIVVLNLPGVVS